VTLPVSSGLRVVTLGGTLIGVTDLGTGEQTTITGVPDAAGFPQGAVVRRGGLVIVNESRHIAYLPDLVADPTIVDLGEGDSVLVSDRADRVWIVAGDPWSGELTTAREVDLTGRVTAGPIALPSGVSVVGGVPDGLVVGSRDGIFSPGP
jgi:hypothetical protein